MAFNYNKLSGKIVEVFGTRYNFAKAMGWSERTLSLKMSGKDLGNSQIFARRSIFLI